MTEEAGRAGAVVVSLMPALQRAQRFAARCPASSFGQAAQMLGGRAAGGGFNVTKAQHQRFP